MGIVCNRHQHYAAQLIFFNIDTHLQVQAFTILVLYSFHEVTSASMTLGFYLGFLLVKLQVADSRCNGVASQAVDTIHMQTHTPKYCE